MSRDQRQHKDAKLAAAETISDPIRPETEETKERPQQSAVKPNDPSSGQALTVRDEHSSRKVPRLKVVKLGGCANIFNDHPDPFVARELIMQALGTENDVFAKELVIQLNDANPGGDENGLNFLLSVIKDIKPKDQLEAMLSAQMAVTHSLFMNFANRLNHAQNIQERDSAERAFNKLSRTFTTQMEALKRYQTGGDRKVTVQQVSVSEGGQAIVGNVTQSVREAAPDKAATSPESPRGQKDDSST